MQSETQRLRDLCSLIVDCPHSTPVWTESGYIVIRNQNIKGGRLDLSSPSFTDEEHFAHRIRRAKPTAGDIIFTREAPMGEVCMVPPKLECCVGQRQVLLRPNPKEVDGRFLLYALQSPQVQHEISWSEGTGSTVSNVRIPVLEALRIPTPDLNTQREIGLLLGTLDDRIDLLRQTNATLESIAQALFRSWFIDFDPVRAKAEGREPKGMDAATAALFPAEFEASALGAIPKEWRVGCLGEVMTQRASRTKASNLTVDLPYVPIECITAKSVFLRESLPGEQAQSSLTLFKQGDILFGAMRPYFHKVCLAPFDGVTRTTAFVLQAEHKAFALFAAFENSTIEFATTHSEGSTIPYAKWSGSLERKPLTLPPRELLDRFEDVVVPVLDAGIQNTRRMQNLAETRDELLPRLISGKLRLPEAQEQVEDALA